MVEQGGDGAHLNNVNEEEGDDGIVEGKAFLIVFKERV